VVAGCSLLDGVILGTDSRVIQLKYLAFCELERSGLSEFGNVRGQIVPSMPTRLADGRQLEVPVGKSS